MVEGVFRTIRLCVAQGPFESLRVDISRKMNRAFCGYGVPAGGIGRAKILDLEADTNDRFGRRKMTHAGCDLPGCAAGRAANDPQRLDPRCRHRYFKLR
jgi:hypothetical protein